MKILLIEDDKKLCEFLQFQLQKEGHKIDCCHDGRDGMDLFLQDGHDLVLLDRMLPTMNGMLVLKKARAAGIQTPVIVITALGELYDRIEGLDSGADDYIVKPFEFEELSARIQCNIDIFSQHTNQLTLHKEYAFTSSAGQEYYASAGVIPKKNGCLGILILSSLKEQQSQIQYLRFVVCLTGIAALFLLFLFSRSFIRRLIIPLEKSQKRQTHFIASASHELRAPLSVLRSGLEVLEKTEDPAKQAHTIALLQDEGLRMQNLIRDMLLLANSDSGELPLRREFWQPDSILLHVFENYEPLAAKKSIRLSIQIPEELLPNCCCDRERIIQVFSILLNNALSYTPEGGKIHLSLTYEKPFLAFRFTDTGCGISDREKHLIFDRFYRSDQAHSDREHFGLGLCIAKEIVTSHQGRIGVENNPTGGSCFYVKLPGQK